MLFLSQSERFGYLKVGDSEFDGMKYVLDFAKASQKYWVLLATLLFFLAHCLSNYPVRLLSLLQSLLLTEIAQNQPFNSLNTETLLEALLKDWYITTTVNSSQHPRYPALLRQHFEEGSSFCSCSFAGVVRLLLMTFHEAGHFSQTYPVIRFNELNQLIVIVETHLLVSIGTEYFKPISMAPVLTLHSGIVVGSEIGQGVWVFAPNKLFEGYLGRQALKYVFQMQEIPRTDLQSLEHRLVGESQVVRGTSFGREDEHGGFSEGGGYLHLNSLQLKI